MMLHGTFISEHDLYLSFHYYRNIKIVYNWSCPCTRTVMVVPDRITVGFITTCAISAYISPHKLWVRTSFLARFMVRFVLVTKLCDQVCQWLVTGQWFSPGTPVSYTNKTDCHDIIEILLKVGLNTINLSPTCLCTWCNSFVSVDITFFISISIVLSPC